METTRLSTKGQIKSGTAFTVEEAQEVAAISSKL